MGDAAPSNIVILGAGIIGQSLAAVFADAGWSVALADPNPAAREAVPTGLEVQRNAIRTAGLWQGGGGAVQVLADAGDALSNAAMVLECGPEDLVAKKAIFRDLLAGTSPDVILATASSAIVMSDILPDATDQARCLVAHPVNPPAVLRVIELVPAPGTRPDITKRSAELFSAAGFQTVMLAHEIEGFVMNRLQSAVLRESYRLVDEGIANAEGIDKIMRMALGPRWALSGPFETADLNTAGGIAAHAARMGPAYKRIGEARGEAVDWHDDLVNRVTAERRAVCAEADLPKRAAWRAGAVAQLVKLRDALWLGADV
ncbi:3-hydroxyacyl-CoA dehydrogenase NAD-binding domain-containing protein [Aliiroseovarius sp. YM-037]|uniref:3-hydroxyacyl-CoA dehydrogenase NAD-binding domain-containing protein n=1 Tax=Aliiroseovarius sp. YM-037 TaxID=3341728 RepID=UPI003A7FC4B6